MDTAALYISNSLMENVTFFSRSTECYECPMTNHGDVSSGFIKSHTVDTRWETEFDISCHHLDVKGVGDVSSEQTLCHRTFHFREGGNYTLFVSRNVSLSDSSVENCICRLIVQSPESDCQIPIYIALAVLFVAILLGIAYSAFKRSILYRKLFNVHNVFIEDLGTTTETPSSEIVRDTSSSTAQIFQSDDQRERPPQQKQRLKSLDAFRGLSLLVMIFVNYGGGKYWIFKHSPWNGLTVADLVFPWFIFIMGTAITIVLKNAHSRPVSKSYFLIRIWKRVVILFALGLVLNSENLNGNLQKLRIPGVLQRIAFTYGVTASLEVLFSRPVRSVRFRFMIDQLYLLPHWILNLAFMTAWCVITFAMTVPNCGRGYIGPGGAHLDFTMVNCSGGAAGYIDHWLFGNDHRYCHPTFREVYQSNACYDPEGILGTLNSIFLCFLGLKAGRIMVTISNWKGVIKRFFFWFLFWGSLALLLSKASANGGWIPINKNLWSLSFVLACASMAYFLFGVFYILIDVVQVWSGEPLIYPGMNSVLIYVCHEVFEKYFPISWSVANTHAAQLAMDLWGAIFWLLVSYLLYRKKVFLSI